MEELITLIKDNWVSLFDWASTFVAYFLVFLFKGKVSGTQQNISLALEKFKARFAENEKTANSQLEASKAEYNAAVGEIEKMEARVKRLEATVEILIGADTEELEAEDGI